MTGRKRSQDEMPPHAKARSGRPRAGAPARRDAILDAALDLFIERGVGATTMSDVASRARASKATLYKLFADTDALFSAVLLREVERRGGGIVQALGDPDLARALAAAANAMLDALEGRTIDLFRLVIAEAGRRPEVGRAFYDALVEASAKPTAERIARDLNISQDASRIAALQFVGAVKEPLFYPKLMGVAIEADRRPIVERAVTGVVTDWNAQSSTE